MTLVPAKLQILQYRPRDILGIFGYAEHRHPPGTEKSFHIYHSLNIFILDNKYSLLKHP